MNSRWTESALSWWEEAGVDTIVGESPREFQQRRLGNRLLKRRAPASGGFQLSEGFPNRPDRAHNFHPESERTTRGSSWFVISPESPHASERPGTSFRRRPPRIAL